MQTKQLFILITGLFLSIPVLAQNKWTTYLNKNSINCIATENNLLWVGTDAGLVCMDTTGKLIKEYTTSNGLDNNYITSITIDNKGNKWVTHDSTLSKFDGTKWTIYDPESLGIIGDFHYSTTDNKGTMWFGDYSGIYKFDGTNWTEYNSENSNLASTSILNITSDKQGNLWIGTFQNGVYKFDGTNWTNFNRSNSGLADTAWTVFADANDNIWIGTNMGVSKFDGTTWINYDQMSSHPGYITSIAEDKKNNLWFASTDTILHKFDGTTWSSFSVKTRSRSVDSYHFVSLAIDANNKIWLGSPFTNSIYKFDEKKSNEFIIGNHSSYGNGSIAIDNKNNKWFLQQYGNAYWFDGTNRTVLDRDSVGSMYAMAVDNNYIWLGGAKGITKYNGTTFFNYNKSNSGFPGAGASSIAIDKLGNKWVGSWNGITKFDGSNWVNYNTENSGLVSNNILSIAIDHKGNVWIGTTDGISKFNGSIWTTYNMSNSKLESNYVNKIYIDQLDRKWIIAKTTLYSFDDIKWKKYDSGSSGLPNTGVNSVAIDEKNIKWVATNSGVYKFDDITWTMYNWENSGLLDNTINSVAIDLDGTKWFWTRYGLTKLEDNGAKPPSSEDKLIYGSVFNDLNGNGVKDNGEPLLPYKYIKVLNDSSFVTTKDDGTFCLSRPKGTFQIKVISNKYWKITTDSIRTIEIKDTTQQIRGIDFGIKTFEKNLSVDITGSAARAGFQVNYWLNYMNLGIHTESGTLTLQIDSNVNFIYSNPIPDNINGKSLTWNYSDLVPLANRNISISLQMPDVSHLGDTIVTSASILPIVDDFNPSDNKYTLKQVLTGSKDPNDKLVENGVGDSKLTLFNEELLYTIRFQNKGTDTAFNVVVRDTLDRNLNMETFRLVSSSHNVNVDIKDKNVVSFVFNDIELPDDKKNEPASNGFVKYAIRPNANLPENTEVKNKAYIYFDYNPAVVTNEVLNTLVSSIGSKSLAVSTNTLSVEATGNSSASFTISSNTNWSISCSQSWVTISKVSGANDANISISSAENTTLNPRTAVITITGDGVAPKSINVTQKAKSLLLSVSPKIINLASSEKNPFHFDIVSNVKWTINCDETWLTIEPRSGTDSDTIFIVPAANSGIYRRSAVVTISADGLPSQIVTINQLPSAVNLSASVDTILVEKDKASFDIVSNVSWTITADMPWVKTNSKGGNNNMTVIVTTATNNTGNTRFATLTINGPGIERTVVVKQIPSTTGIDDIANSEVALFPNPVEDKLSLSFTDYSLYYTIHIFSAEGISVYSSSIDKEKLEIDLSRFSSGIYLVQIIRKDNTMFTKKIVKGK